MKHNHPEYIQDTIVTVGVICLGIILGFLAVSCHRATEQPVIKDMEDTTRPRLVTTCAAATVPHATVPRGNASRQYTTAPAVKQDTAVSPTALGENKILQHYIELIDKNYPRLSCMEDAFAYVESGYDPTAYNRHDRSCGLLAIRQCMLDHFHQIIGEKIFTLEDMFEESYALLVFEVVQLHDNPKLDIKQGCRVWNRRHPSSYYHKINKKFQSNLKMPVNELVTANM